MKNWIIQTLENKHTSISAFVIFLLQAAAIWWPEYSGKLNQISMLAAGYAALQAGDAKAQGAKIQQLQQDTASLTKDQSKP